MFFFQLHTLEDDGDNAVVFEVVKAPQPLLVAAVNAFTGQSFPTFFGSKKIAASIERGSLYTAQDRTFGRVFTEAKPERVRDMMVAHFGGDSSEYAPVVQPDPAGAEPSLLVRRLQPNSQTVELFGNTYVDNALKNDTQVTGIKEDGSTGALVRSRAETGLIVTDSQARFTDLLVKPEDIALWFDDIVNGTYTGQICFDIALSEFMGGRVELICAPAGDTPAPAKDVIDGSKNVDIETAMGSSSLGFILHDTLSIPLPVTGERILSVEEVTAIAAASRDGVLLPSLEWTPTRVVTQVASLELARLYQTDPT